MKIGNLVASSVILVWGAAVLLFALLGWGTSGADASGAFQAGQKAGLVFAAVLHSRAPAGFAGIPLGAADV